MAVSNVSEKALTIKNMWNMLSSDAWSLDRALYYCVYENASIVQLDLLLNKYQSYFSQFLVEVKVDEKYYYSPQMFAQDYYGDPGLDYLVMYFSNIMSNFEFNKPKIKVLNYSKLKDINLLYTKYRKEIDDSKSNPPVYTYNDTKNTEISAKYLQK